MTDREKALTAAGLVVLLIVLQIIAGGMVYTGDEPRYVRQAYSFFQTGGFRLPFEDWAEYAKIWGIGAASPQAFDMVQSPLHTIILSPVVGLFGPNIARLVDVGVSLVAFLATAGILLRVGFERVGFIAVALVWLTLPIFGFSRSLYAEIWLAGAFSCAWYLLNQRPAYPWRLPLFLLAALSLPFFHIRMALVSVCLVSFLVWQLFISSDDTRWRKQAIVAVASAVGLLLFLAFQRATAGGILGSASTPYTPSFDSILPRLGVHLLGIRHGLLVYNPLMICALCGLVLGVGKRNQLALQASALFVIYAISIAWGTASESLPARFWAGIAPVFAVGLAIWLRESKPMTAWAITAFLALLSLIFSGLYLYNPSLLLVDRQSSVLYDLIFRYTRLFYLPNYIPWDTFYDESAISISSWPQSLILLKTLAAFVAILSVFLVFSVKYKEVGRIAGWLAAAVLIIAIWQTHFHEIGHVTVSKLQFSELSGLTLTFAKPVEPTVLRFIDTIPHWSNKDFPEQFRVQASNDDRNFRDMGIVFARHITALPAMGAVKAIRLIPEGGSSTGKATWLNSRISTLARR